MEKLKSAWQRFWFLEQSTLPLDLFRICLGLCVLQSAYFLFPELLTWFGEDGWAPAASIREFYPNILPLLPPGDGAIVTVFWILVAAAACLTAGLFTRGSAIVVWLCLMALHYFNPFCVNSGDALLRICAFFLIFSPAGNVLSIDRLLIVRRTGSGGAIYDGPPRSPWAQRLIQVQVALIYWQAFWGKIEGPHWLDGTAVYYVTHLTELQRFFLPMLFENMLVCKVLTWGTLVLEFCLWSLIWFKRCRYVVLIFGVLLHAGIDVAMNLPVFEVIMISTYLLFIEPADLERWLRKIATWKENRSGVAETGSATRN